MLLIKLNNNVVKKKSLFAPFFFFKKFKKFRVLKKKLQNTEKSMSFKKGQKFNYLVTTPQNKFSYTIYSDRRSMTAVESTTFLYWNNIYENCWFSEGEPISQKPVFLQNKENWDFFFSQTIWYT